MVRQTLQLGRSAGIRVGPNWSVLAIAVLIAVVLGDPVQPEASPGNPMALYWVVAIASVIVFLVSLLAHECAHRVAARRRGVKVRSTTLWIWGGMAEFEEDPPTPRVGFEVAVAGPLTSVALAVVFALAALTSAAVGVNSVVVAALTWMGMVNALLAVFNLLPGAPLDGGRILQALVWRLSGDRVLGLRIATSTGIATGGVLAVLGVIDLVVGQRVDGLMLVLVGWLIGCSARSEQQVSTMRAITAGLLVREVMTPQPVVAPAWVRVGTFVDEVATKSRQVAFPVVGIGGELRGVLTLDTPTLATAQDALERVDALAVRLPADYVVTPDSAVAPLIGRACLGGELAAVVVDDGLVVGMVTDEDLLRHIRLCHMR